MHVKAHAKVDTLYCCAVFVSGARSHIKIKLKMDIEAELVLIFGFTALTELIKS